MCKQVLLVEVIFCWVSALSVSVHAQEIRINEALNEIQKSIQNQDFEKAKLHLNAIDVGKITEMEANSQNPQFIAVAGFDLSYPGLISSVFIPDREDIIIFPGTSDVVGPEVERAQFEQWRNIAFAFAREFNLLMYYKLSSRGKLPKLNLSMEEVRKSLKMGVEVWDKMPLESKLILQNLLLEFEICLERNDRLAENVDALQMKVDNKRDKGPRCRIGK